MGVWLVAVTREKFSSQAPPELLAAMREIARKEGRHFQAILEDALREYVDNSTSGKPRASVMAQFRASVQRNSRLGELLAR